MNPTIADEGRVGLLDWLMLALAVFSIGLLAYAMLADVPVERRQTIFLVDTIICGVFAIEFIARWTRADRPRTFPLRRWYEIVGMIPVAHPALRSFRLLRLVRIVVLLSRVGRAADRALGDEFTYRIMRRFRNAVSEAISDTVALRVLDQIEQIILHRPLTPHVATALEGNRQELHRVILEKVKRDPTVGRLRYVPFFDELVETMSHVTQRVLIELLRDSRTDRVAKGVVRDNLDHLRDAVREHDQASRALRDLSARGR